MNASCFNLIKSYKKYNLPTKKNAYFLGTNFRLKFAPRKLNEEVVAGNYKKNLTELSHFSCNIVVNNSLV